MPQENSIAPTAPFNLPPSDFLSILRIFARNIHFPDRQRFSYIWPIPFRRILSRRGFASVSLCMCLVAAGCLDLSRTCLVVAPWHASSSEQRVGRCTHPAEGRKKRGRHHRRVAAWCRLISRHASLHGSSLTARVCSVIAARTCLLSRGMSRKYRPVFSTQHQTRGGRGLDYSDGRNVSCKFSCLLISLRHLEFAYARWFATMNDLGCKQRGCGYFFFCSSYSYYWGGGWSNFLYLTL